MVEVGSIQIGGTIQTQEIERGLMRVEKGFSRIDTKEKSVNADLERMNQQSKRLAKTFGLMAITGAGALIAIAKGAPAVAGAMAKIKVSAMKLQFAVGTALKDEFESFSGILGNMASWVEEHPDLFSGIVKSILGVAAVATVIKVGGWVYGAFAGFFGLISGLATWSGWGVLAGWFAKLGGWVKTAAGGIAGFASKAASATGLGLGSLAGTLGAGIAIGVGPIINTYQREITGEPGFLDKMLQRFFGAKQGQMSRQDWENQISYTL